MINNRRKQLFALSNYCQNYSLKHKHAFSSHAIYTHRQIFSVRESDLVKHWATSLWQKVRGAQNHTAVHAPAAEKHLTVAFTISTV